MRVHLCFMILCFMLLILRLVKADNAYKDVSLAAIETKVPYLHRYITIVCNMGM